VWTVQHIEGLMLWGLLALAGLVVAWVAVHWRRRFAARMRTAVQIAEEVASGHLEGATVWVTGNDDASRLIRSLQTMRGSLARARDEEIRIQNELRNSAVLMAEARDQALAGTRAKLKFLAAMSHELRTPLNAIIGYAELLHEEASDGGTVCPDDVRAIRSAGRHLLGLVDDILDLSRLEADRMHLDVHRVHLQPLVEEVICTVRPVAPPFALRVDLPPGLGTLDTDAHALSRVLVNLVGNAVKFTREGEVVLRAERAGVGVTFEVRDTGIGMDRATLSRVFEPFVQAEESSRRLNGGTGLGLTIARRLVGQLGGTLEVESEPGVGSVFRFTLPDLSPAHPSETAEPLVG